ncbi:PO22 protein, partial [Gymnorhina tibicen]|nr:PO22 protein [Gymnorhina tibicen]
RANVYPTREFLARGRHDVCVRSCRHCGADYETAAHVIGNCPITQDASIKRHNSICETLSCEARKEGWIVFQEPYLKDDQNEIFKPDLIFVKEGKAFVVDVTVRYEHNNSSLKEAAAEKARKYQRLLPQICDLTNATAVEFVAVEFVGFPLGAQGKWHEKNAELLQALGLSKTRQGRIAQALASRALFSFVDIVHTFSSTAR